MATLFGNQYTKQQLLQQVGSISQICGTKLYEFIDGPGKGVRAVDFSTGSGLDFTVVIDRGMDISRASFGGASLCWHSAVPVKSPAFYEPEGAGWLRTFFGGLLTTCGLSMAGHPCEDEGQQLGLHGRHNALPARLVALEEAWANDEYTMYVKGVVEESSVFGDKLRLTRTISTRMGATTLSIHDKVENFGSKTSPCMLMYHINLGFPVVAEGSRLIASSSEVVPVDDLAKSELDHFAQFTAPQPGCSERCYIHKLLADEAGLGYSAVVNDQFNNGAGLGCYLKISTASLPYMTQWKMMGEGEYVVGTEPANFGLGNRADHRKNGTLPQLEPGQEMETNIEVGVLAGQQAISEFENKVQRIKENAVI